MTKIPYTDPRFGDFFVIHLDEDDNFSFIGVERFLGNVTDDPIRYEHLGDIPQPHKHQVEQKINDHKRRFKK